ncbi:MAG: N-acetylmuramic acid 6-phosphate etherase [Armatimonadota bacterium]|jgi:N-acetylmuramic acid 6-phosphate etherase
MESNLPTTELINDLSNNLDQLSTFEMLAIINQEDAKAVAAVQSVLPNIAAGVDRIADAFRSGGRLVYIGAGTSGRLGVLDASECLPTFGVSPEMVFGIIAGGERALTRAIEGAEDDAAAGVQAIRDADIQSVDVVVGISASGGAPFVRAALAEAKRRGATTVGIANSQNAPLCADADIPIEAVVGPEVLQGSTRMKSGTAQKLILNMLSTGAMVRIGKTYGNRMVDVQCSNAKLVKRAQRLVADIGQVSDPAAAQTFLDAAGGSVKTAIVMARRGVDKSAADALLRASDGFLSRVIDL